MKIRSGFVSNSSSTSFLIVGVNNYRDPRLARLAKLDCWHEDGYGYNAGKTLVFLGNNYDYDDDGDPCDYQPSYVGIDAEKALRAGKTVQDLKKDFIERAKALGVNFQEAEVDLHFGEASSE